MSDGFQGRTKVFFDTEFYEDGKTIELISIGAVREDGAMFYRETLNAADLCGQSDWLRANVRPHLKLTDATLRSRQEIAVELRDFVGSRPEFWAYFADYDWVVLCQLYGRMIDLPQGFPFYCRDVKQEMDRVGVKLPKLPESAAHDALADAIWCRDAWLKLHGGAP